uniref:Uncharacterized protein n=1 Tax=Compsopogon caeruleus TaxID=31354 RepID=A0A6T6BLN9_9RHOD|mmetsp:Transcript_16432/g.33512  ORF Transcript_16432/g.33512 Transcript_16432/m.33512 type:complete len:174 (+) Transcript_16432:328-849(+)
MPVILLHHHFRRGEFCWCEPSSLIVLLVDQSTILSFPEEPTLLIRDFLSELSWSLPSFFSDCACTNLGELRFLTTPRLGCDIGVTNIDGRERKSEKRSNGNLCETLAGVEETGLQGLRDFGEHKRSDHSFWSEQRRRRKGKVQRVETHDTAQREGKSSQLVGRVHQEFSKDFR